MSRCVLHLFSISLFFIVSVTRLHAQTLPTNEASWLNRGTAFTEGVEGQWDRYLWGGFANSLVKKDNTYYLYYQGSITYDDACDSVSTRSIGVATSTDGINWTNHPQNPVIAWSQFGSIEEGAASSAAWVGSDGDIYVYYGANSGSGCTVNAAGRLARSSNGTTFTDLGQVISPTSTWLWGQGDEIFPIGAYQHISNWYVFYTPNGVTQSRKLGVVWGNSATNLTSSSAVNSGVVPAWGPVSVILRTSDAVAFVNNPSTNNPVDVYRFAPTTPSTMTLDRTYTFPDCSQASVIYESDINRWLMLCRSKPGATSYLVKTSEPVLTPSPTIETTPSPTLNPTPTQPSTDTDGNGVTDFSDYLKIIFDFDRTSTFNFVSTSLIDIFDVNYFVTRFTNSPPTIIPSPTLIPPATPRPK